ncbi:MAG: aldo/keto reductase [Planctomycetaceae bacterium]
MFTSTTPLRPVGTSGLMVSAVALGCWPIAGMSSLDVNDADSLATLHAALDNGINFLDTAYCYGANGESEKLIARAIVGRRNKVVIATKGGLHWEGALRIQDASPTVLLRECDESLQRLQTDRIDLYYLHAPAPSTSVAESAAAIRRLKKQGKIIAVGASNLTSAQLREFQDVCPLDAYQPPYNMLQREIEADVLPWCQKHNVAVMVYWPLLKGLLAGKLPRDFAFRPGDGRAKYPMFQGEEWGRNQDFVDELRQIAEEMGRTVSQLVIRWTIEQPGITAALCGAKRAEQIQETAAALSFSLTDEQKAKIDAALKRRGKPASGKAV